MEHAVTFIDILDAQRAIGPYLRRTPLYHYASLSQTLGFDVFIKHENHQPVGAFKVRGGVNLISRLSEADRRRGVIAVSTGNHGQSVAFAGRLFGVRAIVVVPQGANPDKVRAMRELGAVIEFHGRDFDEARLWVEDQAQQRGYRYIHSANEPLLIAGVGTIGLEILEDCPDIDAIIVPVGGGSGAAGVAIAAKTINPRIQAIAVQSAHARVAHDSWAAKSLLASDVSTTFAEGMATRQAFAMTQTILRDLLDDFLLVTDDALRASIRLLFDHTHNVAEGAGAAALAGAVQIQERLQGKKVALDLSGGNITAAALSSILSG